VLEEALAEVAYDPWRFEAPALVLTREALTMVRFARSDPRRIPASQRRHNAVVEQRLTLPPDCELRQHLSNTIARHTARVATGSSPPAREEIDGVVALAMALRGRSSGRGPCGCSAGSRERG
jgi:hypothetical protein